MTIESGTLVKGVVVKITDYGAIVRLPEGKTGLIHISAIADTYVRDAHDYFSENDEVTVKVLRVDDRGRYELSTKRLGPKPPAPIEQRDVVRAAVARSPMAARADRFVPPPPRPVTFEDRLSRFLKDSEERQGDLKRNIESKRGRR